MIKVLEARFLTTAVSLHQYPPGDLPEVAFVGRSNVGKSSLLNALANQKALARVSKTPGRTRLINVFVTDWLLFTRIAFFLMKVQYAFSDGNRHRLKRPARSKSNSWPARSSTWPAYPWTPTSCS